MTKSRAAKARYLRAGGATRDRTAQALETRAGGLRGSEGGAPPVTGRCNWAKLAIRPSIVATRQAVIGLSSGSVGIENLLYHLYLVWF